MRTLNFIVEDLSIKKDPVCNFAGLVPGTRGYLKAKFNFDQNWSGCKKMAVFTLSNRTADIPVKLENDSCVIPEEVLAKRYFSVKIIGVQPDLRLVTNSLEVRQDG
jgi:hypothetical protein